MICKIKLSFENLRSSSGRVVKFKNTVIFQGTSYFWSLLIERRGGLEVYSMKVEAEGGLNTTSVISNSLAFQS